MSAHDAPDLAAVQAFKAHRPILQTLTDGSQVIDCERCGGAIGYVISDGRIAATDDAYEPCTIPDDTGWGDR